MILAIFRKKTSIFFSPLEIFTLSPALGLIVFDLIMILAGKSGLLINKSLILSSIFIFLLICFLIYRSDKKEKSISQKSNIPIIFDKKQTIFIVLILFLTIFIKTVYLKDSIFPTSTDLGHHMYWAKLISSSGELPDYRKNEILEMNDNYLMKSEPIADFIIGEHLIFSGVNLLTNLDFISYFPALLLLLINIFSILAIFILALKIFESLYSQKNKILSPTNLSIFTLFLAGPLYALASPQAKFVSGGVIGNLIGNLLIPASLYFFFYAVKEKNSWIMFLGLFSSAGIFYTHHLSGFIFIFIFIFIILVFISLSFIKILIQNEKEKPKTLWIYCRKLVKDIMALIYTPQVISFLILTFIFVFFVYTPSYLSINAQTTVVGTPSKSTRAGLTWEQFKYATGESRLVLGIIGMIVLGIFIFTKKKAIKNSSILAVSILIGWALSVSLMTTKPHWLQINIPSDRVANYVNFPFLILASLGFMFLISKFIKLKNSSILSPKHAFVFFVLTIATLSFQGFYDNAQSLSDNSKNQKALQTFHLSNFLAQQTEGLKDINILKDHNYLSADSWIKLFFMQDYNYPLSRGFFKRYEDITKPREMCTLWMISEPSSERSTRCFTGTKTKYIIVDTTVDGPQFQNNQNFSKIYEGPSLSIFSKSDK